MVEKKVTTQGLCIDGEEGTTKYAKVSKRETTQLFKDKSYKIFGGCFEVYKEKGGGFKEAVYLVNFGHYL